jgi:hypothetical protein
LFTGSQRAVFKAAAGSAAPAAADFVLLHQLLLSHTGPEAPHVQEPVTVTAPPTVVSVF